MDVKIYCARNNYYEGEPSTQIIEVKNLESCFMLPDYKMLVVADGKTTIYDDCGLYGMEEIK